MRIVLLALCAAGLSQAQTHSVELPASDRVSERASLKRVKRIRYEPAGSLPSREQTWSWRRELDYQDLGERGLQVERARTWSAVPQAAGPGAPAGKPKQVERTLPCEGQVAPRDAFPALAWGDAHPLQALLPGREVEVGERWTPALDAAPALLGSLACERIEYEVEGGALEATLQAVEDGEAVIAFVLKLTYAKPANGPGSSLGLDFAAALEATGTLRVRSGGGGGLQLVLNGVLQVKEHYSGGRGPSGKFDHTVSLHRELRRGPAK